jgi:tetratricopeptide (TPR) repeat protein
MDEQIGRLVAAFEKSAPGPHAIAILSDHGEGLGEHGEQQHGNLLYQTTMHIPMVLVGPGVVAGTSDLPVSSRHIAHTLLDWAGIDSTNSLRKAVKEVVAGEAMKPFLDYGWLPQVMAVDGSQKAILAGRVEVYDIAADPAEKIEITDASLSREVRATLREYPVPSAAAAATAAELDDEGRRKLASLGYIASTAKPVVRANAPRPADMAHLFPILDRASGLFVREQYAEAIPLLETISKADPHNLDAALRLATAHSSLGHDDAALAAFRRAEAIAPESRDVRTYLALHLARGRQWQSAVPMLERVVTDEPERVPALEALAVVRERQGRIDDAVALRRRIYALRAPNAAELVRLGLMEMSLGQTAAAISSLEKARAQAGAAFEHQLELGVLYLAAGRTMEARDALDRAPQTPMALFKRAQVAVLLREPDAAQRVERARQNADATTRMLIERERLFR